MPGVPKLPPRKKQHKYKLGHAFQWLASYEGLTQQDLEEHCLVKGVCATLGEAKRGENMTRDNLIHGTGAMATAAMLGFSIIDIDHHTTLPDEYGEKYGKAISDPYPSGYTLDAGVSESEKGKPVTEFIAALDNPHVYNMVKQNKFVGCSVVDFLRSFGCTTMTDEEAQLTSERAGCTPAGSKFVDNTLVLEAVPNAHGTWVAPLTLEDIPTPVKQQLMVKKCGLGNFVKEIRQAAHNNLRIKNSKKNKTNANEGAPGDGDGLPASLIDYMDADGMWIDGVQSATDFLLNEKGLDGTVAEAVAAVIIADPELLSQYQLAQMSADDIEAWYTHRTATEAAAVNARKLAIQNYLVKNAKNLAELKQVQKEYNEFVPYGQGEVNYGAREPDEACASCRWFSSDLVEDDDGTSTAATGYCAIVAGTIHSEMGCDQHELNPQVPEEEPAAAPPEVAPDEDGNCPDGYEINEDGTMCMLVAPPPEEGEGEGGDAPPAPPPAESTGTKPVQQKPVPAAAARLKPGKGRMTLKEIRAKIQGAIRPGVIIEEDANNPEATKERQVNARLNHLERKLQELSNAARLNKVGLAVQAEYLTLKDEYDRLLTLKKNMTK